MTVGPGARGEELHAGGAGDGSPRPAADPTAALADALARTSVFARLDRTALEELARRGRVRRYDAGELLMDQGEPGGALLVLLSGAVTVYRRSARGGRAALAHLRPPAVLGEVTLLDAGPRSASVEAVEPTHVVELVREDLLSSLADDPALLDGVLHALGALVRRLSERAADSQLLDLPGRVAKTLVLLAGPGSGPHVVRLSQTRLAELVAGSRQSVNETIGAFSARGLLHVEGRSIVLDDVEGLRRRAGLLAADDGVPR